MVAVPWQTEASDPPVNCADREHFQVHRDRDTGERFIGNPLLSRRTNTMMVPVTRHLLHTPD